MRIIVDQLANFSFNPYIENVKQAISPVQKKVAMLALVILCALAVVGFYCCKRFKEKKIDWLKKAPDQPVFDSLKKGVLENGKILRIVVGGRCLETYPCQHPDPKIRVMYKNLNEESLHLTTKDVCDLFAIAPPTIMKGFGLGHFKKNRP